MAQTSINIQPVKGGSEQHNKREKKLDYVREDLSHLNEYWEQESQAERLEFVKANAKAKTGRKMQDKATPIREAVVVIKDDTTMADMQRLSAAYKERFGIDAFQIAIHKDEGHHKAKEWKPNLHAHIVFDWTDHQTGKSIKLNREDMAEMQTITARVLQMERGVSSDKQHLSAVQFKNQQEELRQQELKAATEQLQVGKARKEAAIEAAKSVSEGVKSIFGVSAKEKEINELKEALSGQKKDFERKATNLQKEKAEVEQRYKWKVERLEQEKNNLQECLHDEKKKAFSFLTLWEEGKAAGMAMLDFMKDKARSIFSIEEEAKVDAAMKAGTNERERKSIGRTILQTTYQALPQEKQDANRYKAAIREVDAVAEQKPRQERHHEQNRNRTRGMGL